MVVAPRNCKILFLLSFETLPFRIGIEYHMVLARISLTSEKRVSQAFEIADALDAAYPTKRP